MGDRILLKGMTFYGYHGVRPEEKELGQRFVVDVEMELDLRAAGASDDLTDTVDYSRVYRVVKEIVEGPGRNLLEAVAEETAGAVLNTFSVSAVRVRVAKPHVSIRGRCAGGRGGGDIPPARGLGLRPEGLAPLDRGLSKSAARASLVAVALLMTALVACTSPVAPTPTVSPTAEPTQDAAEVRELTVVLATTDLGVGENRVAFAILDDGGVLESEEVYATFSTQAGEAAQGDGIQATYREWPGGRGLYTIQADFDAPGVWQLDVDATIDGRASVGSALFQVSAESSSPAVGAAAPASLNKTLGDVARIEEITTDSMPDEALYAMTIAEAIESGKPLVVTFATPAFCKTATCGPQVEALKDLRARYSEQVNFIHVEVFDNPLGDGRRPHKGAAVANTGGVGAEDGAFHLCHRLFRQGGCQVRGLCQR